MISIIIIMISKIMISIIIIITTIIIIIIIIIRRPPPGRPAGAAGSRARRCSPAPDNSTNSKILIIRMKVLPTYYPSSFFGSQ